MKFIKNKNLKYLLIGQMIILVFLLSSVNIAGTVQAKTNQINSSQSDLVQQMQNADLVAIYDANASTNININGVIGPNEYPETFDSVYSGVNVSIAYNGTNPYNSYLFIGLTAVTSGYIAIGFNKLGYGMIGADIKAGWIDFNNYNKTGTEDAFALAYSQPTQDNGSNYNNTYNPVTNPNNLTFGVGSNDIVEAKGTYDQAHNVTTIEMVTRMISATLYDRTHNWAINVPNEPRPNITADMDLYVNHSYSMLLAWGGHSNIAGGYTNAAGIGVEHTEKAIQTLFIAPRTVQKRDPTKLTFKITNNSANKIYNNNSTIDATATLTYANGTVIPNASVGVYYEGLIANDLQTTAVTDQNGVANFTFTYQGEYSNYNSTFLAEYLGGLTTKKSQSSVQMIYYVGSVPVEEAPFLVIPLDMNYIVPWLTGLAAVGTVGFMWTMFAYVIYTVLYKNAVQPDAKRKIKGSN